MVEVAEVDKAGASVSGEGKQIAGGGVDHEPGVGFFHAVFRPHHALVPFPPGRHTFPNLRHAKALPLSITGFVVATNAFLHRFPPSPPGTGG